MPSASPMVAGECWPAVKMPSTSETLSPASRTALVTASTCRLSWLLWGSVPISSDSSTPTMQATLERSRRLAMASPPRRLEQRQRDLVGQLGEHDLHRHVARELPGIGLDVDEVRQHARSLGSPTIASTYGVGTLNALLNDW